MGIGRIGLMLLLKALSLKQPFASWIADGRKTIETRTWRTNHRGRLLICSSKTFHEDFDSTDPHVKFLERGVALATVNLTDCRPMTEEDEKAACCEYYEGAYAWILTDVKKIKPFPVKGQLNVFEVQCTEQQLVEVP